MNPYHHLVCPECHSGLDWLDESARCPPCKKSYSVREGIPVFTAKPGYWCNVDKEDMELLIKEAEDSGDWLEAVNRRIPDYAPAVAPLYRADAQFIFPIDANARVLDAGSMWGGLTVPMAQFCGEVHALDKTWETLRFLKVRSTQMGLNNIVPVVSDLHKLPFPDGYFDFVVLNGVLEWLGLEQDIILERHWKGKRQDRHIHKQGPTQMQEEALRELARVLKPGGGIYIAIENRIGLQYFLGHPDDHVNIRFIPFLPRALANLVTKLVRKAEYRTYIYSPGKLAGLITRAGFANVRLFSAYPHYSKISRLTPFSIFGALRSVATTGYAHYKVYALSLAWRLTPRFSTKHLSPSICAIASKGGPLKSPPRLLKLLESAGVIGPNEIADHELAIVNNRFGNSNTTNYIVFDKRTKRSRFFCKISREKNNGHLEEESESIRYAAELLSSTDIAAKIPRVRYSGSIDGISLQVTDYMAGRTVGKGVLDGIRRINNFIDMRRFPLTALIDPLKGLARRGWLKRIDGPMLDGIKLLAEFQRATITRSLAIDTEGVKRLKRLVGAIRERGMNTSTIDAELDDLGRFLSSLNNIEVPVCMEHGDYDICNFLFSADGLSIVDFEHASREGLPFFDLGNLLFNPLLMEWKCSDKRLSLRDYARKTGWTKYLERWLYHYCICSGLSPELLSRLPTLAVIEQNARHFPPTRDPYDYPMYGEDALREMAGWKLDIYRR